MAAPPSTPPSEPAAPAPRLWRRWPLRLVRWLLRVVGMLAVVAILALIAALSLLREPLALPEAVQDMVQARLARDLGPDLQVEVAGGYDLLIERGLVPRLRARGLSVSGVAAAPVLRAGELRVALDPAGLLRGQLRPQRLALSDLRITLDRAGVEAAGGPVWSAAPRSGSDLEPALAGLRALLAEPELAALQQARITGLDLDLRDPARGRGAALHGADLELRRADGMITAEAQGLLSEYLPENAAGGGAPGGRIGISARLHETAPSAALAVTVEGVPAGLVAVQSPALGWLAPLEAPVSGRVEAGVDPLGQLAPMSMALEIGAGQIHPGGGARPIAVQKGAARLRYDPAERRLVLEDLALDSPALRLRADGHADLSGPDPLRPEALIGQLRLHDLRADPEGVFAAPAQFDSGQVDLRLRLDPLRIDIGQMSLSRDAERLSARGQLRAGEGGWSAALDFESGAITLDQLLALWPTSVVPLTRRWLAENVTTGTLHEARGALRLSPGAQPLIDLSYAFRGAKVRVVRGLPLVEDGAGYATIRDNAHVLVVDRGRLVPPGGYGAVDVAGTQLSVADIRQRPAQANIALRIAAPIPAALALLDQPPFEILKKGGRDPGLAEGQGTLLARISLPFVKSPRADQVDFEVTGDLHDVVSRVLVRNKTLRASHLRLSASAEGGLRIGGKATLDGAPFEGEWVQHFGARGRGRSHLSGRIEISPESLRALKVNLPEGMLSGRGSAQLEVDLIKDQPGPFTFRSDLRGLRLAIGAIGWSKPAGVAGDLVATGHVPRRGVIAPPTIRRFDLSAPGLRAGGDLVLRAASEGGGMARATLDRVQVGDWFAGALVLSGRGRGKAPGLRITGGRMDLTRAPFRDGAPAKAQGDSYRVALDRLVVSRGIYLTGLSAQIATGGGISGEFSGRLNGRGPVRGQISPGPGGRAAVRLRSDQAGAVLAALGLPDRASGGDLDLSLLPARGKAGHYDAQVAIAGMRLRGLPTLGQALMLGKAEAVRQALNGPGLRFSAIRAALRLTPEAIEVTQASGVSPQLGISIAGLYLPGNQGLHLKGVIAPGGVDPEGALFGFAYKLRGTASAPQVSVNPASILAPGNLREAFRRPAPTLEDVRIRD